ncbi:hypothetical protein D3C71_1826840 [compost metagenome]
MVFHVPAGVACASATALAAKAAANTVACRSERGREMRMGVSWFSVSGSCEGVATPIYWRTRRAAITAARLRTHQRHAAAARNRPPYGGLRDYAVQHAALRGGAEAFL